MIPAPFALGVGIGAFCLGALFVMLSCHFGIW